MQAIEVKVWDLFVRVFHWSLVGCVLLNLTVTEEGEIVHRYLGYAAVALVAMRIIWGFVGSRHARFADFIPTPARLKAHWQSLLRHEAETHPGHNPLGAVMIFALMAVIIGLGISGYMMGTDAYFGEEWVEETHEWLANTLIALVVIHVGAVLAMSVWTKSNLPRAMVTGRKTLWQPDKDA